jgi:hypothetical protein
MPTSDINHHRARRRAAIARDPVKTCPVNRIVRGSAPPPGTHTPMLRDA